MFAKGSPPVLTKADFGSLMVEEFRCLKDDVDVFHRAFQLSGAEQLTFR